MNVKAYHNVCSHRGRRLVETPSGQHGASDKRKLFVCGYHGWRYGLDGTCQHVLDRSDWNGALDDLCTRLREVNTGTFERYPTGSEPKTEWVYAEVGSDRWPPVFAQDFSNMAAVQQGMRSRGSRGPLPNPHQERKITNFHRNLAQYMGPGSPRRLEKDQDR